MLSLLCANSSQMNISQCYYMIERPRAELSQDRANLGSAGSASCEVVAHIVGRGLFTSLNFPFYHAYITFCDQIQCSLQSIMLTPPIHVSHSSSLQTRSIHASFPTFNKDSCASFGISHTYLSKFPAILGRPPMNNDYFFHPLRPRRILFPLSCRTMSYTLYQHSPNSSPVLFQQQHPVQIPCDKLGHSFPICHQNSSHRPVLFNFRETSFTLFSA